jgi:hypothetical protein
MDQAIHFESTCPSCKREQPQKLSVAALERLLNGGYPIGAYCVACDEFWPISLHQRVELGELIAARCGGGGSIEGSRPFPRRPPVGLTVE